MPTRRVLPVILVAVLATTACTSGDSDPGIASAGRPTATRWTWYGW
jgi:hypothetical protein